MNVDDLQGEGVKQNPGDDPHKAGQHDQFDTGIAQSGHYGAIESLAPGKVTVIDAAGWNTRQPGSLQRPGLRIIGNDHSDFCGEITILAVVDNGLQVGAAT